MASELNGIAAREVNVTSLIDNQKIGAFQIRILILCALVMFLDGFDTQIVAYIVPVIAKEWHVTKAELGPIFSLGLAGLMVGFLVLSPLSDRIGRRKLILLSTVMFGVFTFATAFVSNIWELGALRFLTGLGLGGAAPGAVALTSEYSPKRLRATWVLIIYCGFSLGFIAAGAAAQLIPAYGWRSVLWMGAAAPIIAAVLIAAFLPESIESLMKVPNGIERIKRTLKQLNPVASFDDVTAIRKDDVEVKVRPVEALFGGGRTLGTFMIWIAFFMNLGMFYFLQSWLPVMLTDLGYAVAVVATVTALTTAGGIIAVVFVGPMMDRSNPYLTVAGLFLGGAVLVAALGATLSSELPVLMTMAFLAGFCISGGQKSGIALSALFYPLSVRSTGVGWCLGISRIGGIIAPMIVGGLLERKWPAPDIFYAGAWPMICAGVAILVMGYRYHTKSSVKSRANG
ncbi:MAG: MFS transporter [Rhodocyclaceae bacterium]|nr:MAG: MFS transporter [Rhodocyclaceae bacterium]